MELYHNNMSVCAQKVRLVLHEKHLRPIEHHMVLRNGDVHQPEYLKLNPKGVVPTLIDRGEVIVESTVICEYLDEAYPENSLRPVEPIARARMRQWTLLPDSSLHSACAVLSTAIAWRHQVIAAGFRQLDQRPDRDGNNALYRSVVEHGLDHERLPAALQVHDQVIASMAGALVSGPWLCGAMYTLADAAMLPYVCRLEDLGLSWFWEGDRAPVARWLERAKARPNYSGIANYYDPKYVELAGEKGRQATPRLKQMLGRA